MVPTVQHRLEPQPRRWLHRSVPVQHHLWARWDQLTTLSNCSEQKTAKRPNQSCIVCNELPAHAATALYVYVSWSKGHCDRVKHTSYQEIQRILHQFMCVCADDGTHGVGRRTSGSTAPELLDQGPHHRCDGIVDNGPDSCEKTIPQIGVPQNCQRGQRLAAPAEPYDVMVFLKGSGGVRAAT